MLRLHIDWHLRFDAVNLSVDERGKQQVIVDVVMSAGQCQSSVTTDFPLNFSEQAYRVLGSSICDPAG
jgi:hypothetical protein